MLSMVDDTSLLAAIAACQKDGARTQETDAAATAAIGELYDRYGRLVFSLAVHIVGDSTVAEEVTQDVFVQVWNKADTFRPDSGKVITWLSSVARYRAIDVLRRQNVRPEGHHISLDDGFFFEEDKDADVESAVEMLIERQRVRHALLQLPPDQRKALALAYFKGLTQQEISEMLNEPLGTVKTRIRLAMQKLRQTLADDKFHE
jgi:RNA polymerase sigma-70 factor (ECF subfamily)